MVRNAHGNNIGAHEMVHIEHHAHAPTILFFCAYDCPCWPMGSESARIGTAYYYIIMYYYVMYIIQLIADIFTKLPKRKK
jgi:hypothetical protein